MKKHDIFALLSLILTPVILIVLGLILLVRPDAAAGLIAVVMGWVILLSGAAFGISLFSAQRGPSFFRHLIAAIVCVGLGGWLTRHPLQLAEFVGRLAGILLMVHGCAELLDHYGRIWSFLTAGVGLMLILLPMTASRLVFSLCGLVVLIIGVVMLLDRLHRKRLESDNDDPNIIDAL